MAESQKCAPSSNLINEKQEQLDFKEVGYSLQNYTNATTDINNNKQSTSHEPTSRENASVVEYLFDSATDLDSADHAPSKKQQQSAGSHHPNTATTTTTDLPSYKKRQIMMDKVVEQMCKLSNQIHLQQKK